MIDVVLWVLCLAILQFAFWPLSRRLFKGCPGGASFMGPTFSLLLYGYLAWIGGSVRLLPFSRGCLILLLLLVGQFLWGLELKKSKGAWQTIFPDPREFGVGLTLLAASFIGFTWVRRYFPEISGDVGLFAAEKFPDCMMLQTLCRSTQLPPPDLWFSGKGYFLNHYYFGYFLIAAVAKLTGIQPSIAYNLGLATIFGLSACTAYGLVSWIGRSKKAGILAAALLLLASNLYGVVHLFEKMPDGSPKPFGDMEIWKGSRVIEKVITHETTHAVTEIDKTINEFPFFSFLLGDLHPHLLSLPLALLVISLVALLRHEKEAKEKMALVLATSLAYGGHIMANSWDLPTFGALILVAILYLALSRRQWNLKEGAVAIAVLFPLSLILFLPYHLQYLRPPMKVKLVPPEMRTFLTQFCVVHGLFLWILLGSALESRERKTHSKASLATFALVFLFAAAGYTVLLRGQAESALWARVLLYAGVTVAFTWVWIEEVLGVWSDHLSKPVPAWFGPMAILCIAALFPGSEALFKSTVPALAVVLLLVSALRIIRSFLDEKPLPLEHLLTLFAAGCLLGCEFFYLEDIYGGASRRMNTVFKFYFQAWIFLAVSGGILVGRLGSKIKTLRVAGIGWAAGFLILFACSFIYTGRGLWSRCSGFQAMLQRPTLDGTLYLKTPPEQAPPKYQPIGQGLLQYSAPEYATLAWMRDECPSAVVFEATGGPYTHYGRVSTFTGWPTVLGWGNHEGLWREWRKKGSDPARSTTGERTDDIRTLYTTRDTGEALRILDKYEAGYVFVGGLEMRDFYGESLHGLRKFDAFMEKAHEDGEVILYRRRPGAAAASVPAYDASGQAPGKQFQDVKLAADPLPRFRDVAPLFTAPAQGRLGQVKDVAVGPDGSIYAVDHASHQVHKFSSEGLTIKSWGGQGKGPGQFEKPCGVGVSQEGRVFVADTWNHRIQVFDPEGGFQGMFEGKNPAFYAPKDVVIANDGKIFVVDTGQHKVHRFSSTFEEEIVWGSVAGPGQRQEDLFEPVGAALGPEGYLYVTDTGHKRVQVFTQDGAFVRRWTVMGWDEFFTEPFICFDPTGIVILSDSLHQRIEKFSADGFLLASWESPLLGNPLGLATSPDGRLIVGDGQNGRVMVFQGFPQ